MGLFNFFKRLRHANVSPEKNQLRPGPGSIIFTNDLSSPEHWRNDPLIKMRFPLADYPDDIQVLVHEGGPRKTKVKPELMYVRVTGRHSDYFKGTILNVPTLLKTLKQGSVIIFKMNTGTKYPIRIFESFIRERKDWEITPCEKCGFTELFDPPSEIIMIKFPDMKPGESVEAMALFCDLCGGIQVITNKKFA